MNQIQLSVAEKLHWLNKLIRKSSFFCFFFFFINSVQDSGGVLNFSIVRAGAKLIVLLHDRSLLFANEGYTELMG